MKILDSTLREGEQTPGVQFNYDEKINIAKMLDDFGVDMIELGHPSVSPNIRRSVQMLATEGLSAETLAHVRAVRSDIDLALSCDVDRIVIFLPTSNVQMYNKLGMDREAVLERIQTEVTYARDHGINVRYTPEDATRTDIDFLLQVCETAVDAGADRISVADTVGIATPKSFGETVSRISNHVNAELDVHCHNDLGLALANALSALDNGANCVHTTVNGLGERCGIIDIANLAAVEHVFFNNGQYKLDLLPEISNYVSQISGLPVSHNSPVVGAYAFTHKSGVHTDGMLKDSRTYQGYNPSILGRRHEIVIDRYTGKYAVRDRLSKLDIQVNDQQLLEITHSIKRIGDSNTQITNQVLRELAESVLEMA